MRSKDSSDNFSRLSSERKSYQLQRFACNENVEIRISGSFRVLNSSHQEQNNEAIKNQLKRFIEIEEDYVEK